MLFAGEAVAVVVMVVTVVVMVVIVVVMVVTVVVMAVTVVVATVTSGLAATLQKRACGWVVWGALEWRPPKRKGMGAPALLWRRLHLQRVVGRCFQFGGEWEVEEAPCWWARLMMSLRATVGWS